MRFPNLLNLYRSLSIYKINFIYDNIQNNKFNKWENLYW